LKREMSDIARAVVLYAARAGACIALAFCVSLPSYYLGMFRGLEAPPCTVARVIDGDTVVVLAAGKLMHVRIAGIDAPERGEPGAKTARIVMDFLCLAPEVVLRPVARADHWVYGYPVDRFGRPLAHVTVTLCGKQIDVGQWMLDHGHAVPWKKRR